MFSSERERARLESCIHQFCCHFSHPKTISQGIVSLSLHGPITLSLSQYLFLAYVYETVACPGFPFPKTKVKHYFLGRLRNASSPSLISKIKIGKRDAVTNSKFEVAPLNLLEHVDKSPFVLCG